MVLPGEYFCQLTHILALTVGRHGMCINAQVSDSEHMNDTAYTYSFLLLYVFTKFEQKTSADIASPVV